MLIMAFYDLSSLTFEKKEFSLLFKSVYQKFKIEHLLSKMLTFSKWLVSIKRNKLNNWIRSTHAQKRLIHSLIHPQRYKKRYKLQKVQIATNNAIEIIFISFYSHFLNFITGPTSTEIVYESRLKNF